MVLVLIRIPGLKEECAIHFKVRLMFSPPLPLRQGCSTEDSLCISRTCPRSTTLPGAWNFLDDGEVHQAEGLWLFWLWLCQWRWMKMSMNSEMKLSCSTWPSLFLRHVSCMLYNHRLLTAFIFRQRKKELWEPVLDITGRGINREVSFLEKQKRKKVSGLLENFLTNTWTPCYTLLACFEVLKIVVRLKDEFGSLSVS